MAIGINYIVSTVGLTVLSFGLFAQDASNNLAIESNDWSISQGQSKPCPDCLFGFDLIVEAVSLSSNDRYSLQLHSLHSNVVSITDMALFDSILSVTGTLFYGGESVTLFDLEDGSKVTEFYGYYVTRSPDNRYFIYKRFFPIASGVGTATTVMLFDVLESREADKRFMANEPKDVGIPIFPPQQRLTSEHLSNIGSTYSGMNYHDLSQAVFDIESKRLIFPVMDKFNNISLASVILWQPQFVSEIADPCVIPLTEASHLLNYFTKESRNVFERIEVLGNSPFVEISLYKTRGIDTNFRMNLGAICRSIESVKNL